MQQSLSQLYAQMLLHMINRSLEAEMDANLGYSRHDRPAPGSQRSNSRNGKSLKTVQSAAGNLAIETLRDRDGDVEPQLVKKRQVRLAGMEGKILALYAKGVTTRDIEDTLVDPALLPRRSVPDRSATIGSAGPLRGKR